MEASSLSVIVACNQSSVFIESSNAQCKSIVEIYWLLLQSSKLLHINLDMINTFRAAWFWRFSQKKQRFSVALPTP